MADAGTDLEAFRSEVRSWIEAHFPAAMRGGSAQAEAWDDSSAGAKEWIAALGSLGWTTPTWPKTYGGGGLSPSEVKVFREEMRRAGAWNPIGFGMGIRMLGPTLLEYGDEAQKLEHIPPICRGETRWCQGYSEPGAGSDLASLQTRAEDRGDHFLVNGQKIWTSGAQYADWCFCLVRTDPSAKKQEGISFLLIDMRSPGIDVRPIRLISGDSPFCETFFQDVKVPKRNLVGRLNGGWTVGKRLLQFERVANPDAPPPRRGRGGRRLQDLAKSYVGVDEHSRLADGDLRSRLTDHLMDRQALLLTLARIADSRRGGGPDVTTSIVKNVSSLVGQQRSELLLEILGSRGLGWSGEGFDDEEIAAVREWLSGKATTIYAGSYEIQNNVISKRILGLPDPIGSESA
ncbi:MAG: acyl-CoA dehydrogenase family protein [Caulobacterales bacterium]